MGWGGESNVGADGRNYWSYSAGRLRDDSAEQVSYRGDSGVGRGVECWCRWRKLLEV